MALHGMGCPGCGGAFGQEDRFCRFCGHSLETGGKGRERRFITALCSDLSGYTSLSETLDQEEFKSFLDSLFNEAAHIITSFGGVVEKIEGDAVMALFGLYRTREDDLVRAIRSTHLIHSLTAEKSLAETHLSMHSGIHAGTVLVDRKAAGGLSLGIMGMPLIIAKRLSDLAEPGEILVAGGTVPGAERFFRTEPLGLKRLDGLRGQMPVHRILSPRERPSGIHRPGSTSSPLVGRSAQLITLREAYQSLSQGKDWLVLITGVPGSGKSRLALEFLNGLPPEACSLTVHCFDHMQDIPYEPVISLIRQMAKPAGEKLAGLDGSIDDLLENPRHAFHIRSLLGMKSSREDLMPDVWKSEIGEAVSSLVQAFANKRPLVICIEDFQWVDASSRDLFLNLARSCEESGRMLLVTSREDSLPGEDCLRIVVEELGREHMQPLLQGLLRSGRVPEDTAESFHRVTGGNPLYIEEYLSFLLERGISPHQGFAGDIPSSIEGIIAARLETLGPACTALLQAASVAGTIFSRDLLRAALPLGQDSEQALCALERAGFIRMDPSGQCFFRHALTRDAAYASLLANQRREFHREIGSWLEGRDRNANCGTIAYHLFHAREYARAYPYCMQAARIYQAAGSWMEAGTHYAWARACILGEETREDRRERLIAVCEGIWSCSRIFNPDQAIGALEDLASLYRESGLASQEAFSRIRLINLYSQKALFQKALDTFDEVSSGVRGDGFLSAAAKTAAAYTYTFLGKPLKALEYLAEARACLHSPDRLLLTANHLTTLAACVWRGDVKEALAWYARLKEGGSPYLDFDLMAEVWLGYVLFLKGELSRGMQVLEEARAREKKLGCLAGGLCYLRVQSSIYLCSRYTGDLDSARDDLAIAQAQGSNSAGHAPLIGLYRAWIALESGQPREAASHALEALPSLEQGIANRVPYALNTLSEALLMLGDLPQAEDAALRSISWNTGNGNLDQLIWALRTLSSVHREQGRDDACREALCRASHLARGSGMLPHVAWNLTAWGDLHAARERGKKAGSCYRRAHALWEAMGSPHQARKIEGKPSVPGSGKALCG